MSKFNLENLSSLKELDIFPKDFNPDDFKNMKGILDLTARMRHNNLSFFTKLDDTEFVYAPKHLKVKFNSGNILLRNNTLALNKIKLMQVKCHYSLMEKFTTFTKIRT